MSKQQDDAIFWLTVSLFCLLAFAVLLPALLFAAFFIAIQRAFKLKWLYMALCMSIMLIVIAISGFKTKFNEYATALWTLYKSGFSFSVTPWIDMLPFSITGGLILSTIIVALTGGHKRQKDITPGPVTSWLKKKALNKVAKEKHPDLGVLIGINNNSKQVILSDSELNQHCALLGTTGSGKTTTILNFVESAVTRNIPLIFIDGKGAQDLVVKVKSICEKYGRKFYLFNMHGESMHYNPLRHGNISELKDKLISLTEWSEEHYKKVAERYLQLVFRCMSITEEKIDLSKAFYYMIPDNLAILARRIENTEARNTILESIDQFSDLQLHGLAARLAVMAESEIGHLFMDNNDDNTIDLCRIINDNAVVLFTLDSLSYPEYSRLLGRLIITDIKSVATKQKEKKIYAIFDEFNVFASDAVVDLVSKSRSFGFHVIIGTQSLSDLERAGGPALAEQVIENCNTYIIQRQNSAVNAEKLANMIGTKDSYETTYQVKSLFKLKTGVGSMRQTREYIVHPDLIKRLKTGEAILVRKTEGFKVDKIKVRNIC
ncbi:MAG: type IV secretion system DNA-binding domain-containing protein [Peptococcaceae bacterium]|nr:type IV secretion system DNA-binding domain-containing protein [Peptococcaceae bacterium]